MLKFLKALHQLRGKVESQIFDKTTTEPEKAQKQFLSNLLKKNAESLFGKMHGFAEIRGDRDFRQKVPVRDYEDFRPFVNRIIAGEQSVLTNENPFMLTMTSGTTGEPKFIPVTRESQAYNSSLMRQWLYRAERAHEGLTAQASVGIVSRAIEGFTASGLPYGSASGVIYKNIPRVIRRAYAVPYLVSEIEDYDERYFVLARFALAQRVSFIATPNPSTLLRLAQICAENQEKLIRAIHNGRLGLDAPKQIGICAELAAKLKPNPKRAEFLSRVVEENGLLRFADCWTDLKLAGCWTGGSVGTQTGKLSAFFGDAPIRDLGYLASEGNISLPIADNEAAGILALHSNYYEFIPETEADSEKPTILLAHELEIGERYSILLTTSAGLYRYKINDIVEVTGFYNRAPLIAFVRKAGEMANITGEKLHANHFLQAIETVCRQFNLKIEQFRAAPNFHALRYEIYLELCEEFPADRLRDEVLPAIDREIQRANIEYAQKRKSKRLDQPRLYLMKRGWANDEFRRYITAGKRDTQYKPRILCSEIQAENALFIAETIEEINLQFSVERV